VSRRHQGASAVEPSNLPTNSNPIDLVLHLTQRWKDQATRGCELLLTIVSIDSGTTSSTPWICLTVSIRTLQFANGSCTLRVTSLVSEVMFMESSTIERMHNILDQLSYVLGQLPWWPLKHMLSSGCPYLSSVDAKDCYLCKCTTPLGQI
jgi:hypothetical protein